MFKIPKFICLGLNLVYISLHFLIFKKISQQGKGKILFTQSIQQQFLELPADWQACFSQYNVQKQIDQLSDFIDQERSLNKIIYPDDVFRALKLSQFKQTKVVILGQDPYHGEDGDLAQAHGLAFSVRPGVRPPPSLKNIYRELQNEFAHSYTAYGCLDTWAQQGVLLLNTVLTVEQGKPASHAKKGWEIVTDALISYLAEQHKNLVFMLWGAHAQSKQAFILPHNYAQTRHLILCAPHPSPLSAHRGFLGCGHFKKANEFLLANGSSPIDWRNEAISLS